MRKERDGRGGHSSPTLQKDNIGDDLENFGTWPASLLLSALLERYSCLCTMTSLPPPPFFLPKPGKPAMTWPSWKRSFLNYLVASGLDGESNVRRKAILYHCLGTEGQRIFDLLPPYGTSSATSADSSASTSTVPALDDVEIALRTLDAHYAATVNPIAERHKFRQRRQQQGEDIDDYVVALRELASTCDFGPTLDCMIRDQIVEAANICHLRERLLLEGQALTLARAVTLARQFQQSQKESKEFAAETSNGQVRRVTKKTFRKSSSNGDRKVQPSTAKTHCFRCGSSAHLANSPSCKARSQRCFACNKTGHFRSVCRSSGHLRELTKDEPEGPALTSESQTVLQLDPSTVSKQAGIYITLSVLDKDIRFLIDTGSSVSILSSTVYEATFAAEHPLKATSVTLYDFSKRSIPIQGCFPASVKYGSRSACIVFYVVANGTTLLGLDALSALQICIDGMNLSCCKTSVSLPPEISAEFCHLFDGNLGLSKNFVHKVKVRSDVQPVAGKLRRLPLTVREQVSQELRRLEELDVIEKVTASEWVSPIVVVKKKDGIIRLCVDLREPNKAVVPDCFPLPHTEELLNALAGATTFSKLDLASAYHQVALHPESRDLTAFITHDGLFRFKRVCFGLASAPSAFQLMMSLVLKGCKGVLFYIDDVIVYGKSEEEHKENLHNVLLRLSAEGLKLNHKCVFNVEELTFLGHVVNSRGLSPQMSTVESLQQAPAPHDVKSLRSFLGLAGYYSRFIPRFAELVEPMRELLRDKNPFVWTSNAQDSFEKVKAVLSSSPILHMFDPRLPVVVTTDASSCGLGAVLQQPHGDELRTVALASRTLSPLERKYSVGEREALACLWACEHWHVYLWGRHFTLRTDHQALVTLLGSHGTGHRPLRISRWSARLLYYSFSIEYKKGAENYVADALSRLPLHGDHEAEEEIVCIVSSAVTKQELQEATLTDPDIIQVSEALERGSWHLSGQVPKSVRPYYRIKDELSFVDGLLHRGERMVIPQSLTSRLLEIAHETHPGIVRTKQRLRDLYWWPGMDTQVERMVHNCPTCQAADKSARTASPPLHPVPLPLAPWSKLGMDIVGPLEECASSCRYAITLVDYHSKWPEISFASSVTTSTVTTFLLHVFSREGYPDEIVTDNGPQFISAEFEKFLHQRGIRHTRVSVYYPQANGQVERFNRVFKDVVQLASLEKKELKSAVLEHLTTYRSTPHATTGVSPAVLLHGRHIRTRLNVAGIPTRPAVTDKTSVQKRVNFKQQKQKTYSSSKRSAKLRQFTLGSYVRVRLPGHRKKGRPNFSPPLKIIARRGPLSFLLEDGKIWHCSKFARSYRETETSAKVPEVPDPQQQFFTSHSWWAVDHPLDCASDPSPPTQAQQRSDAPPLPPLLDDVRQDVLPASQLAPQQRAPELRRSERQRTAPKRYPEPENNRSRRH